MRRARARVEGSPLRASDALLHLCLVEDDVTKGLVARGAERLAACVGDEAEGDDALPGLLGIGEATLRRAPMMAFSETIVGLTAGTD